MITLKNKDNSFAKAEDFLKENGFTAVKIIGSSKWVWRKDDVLYNIGTFTLDKTPNGKLFLSEIKLIEI
jgi:hypothetical protein